jgi:hypothetical protein
MTHITSRNQLLTWLAQNAPNKTVGRAIDRGQVIVHGLFEGGWVVSTVYLGRTHILGIRPMGVERRLVCGLLSRVPIEEYIGGETLLTKGD